MRRNADKGVKGGSTIRLGGLVSLRRNAQIGNRSNQPQQTGVELMKRITTILLAIAVGTALVSVAVAKDTGSRDILRLSNAELVNGEWQVAVHVINDQELAGLDIPIRFGQPGEGIELLRVDFTDRVANWDFTHAQIDNQAKTVILGLISELVGTRPSADLKAATRGTQSQIATLVFKVEDGEEPNFSTFTTKSPGHELTFIYNDNSSGRLEVVSYHPAFETDVEFKGTSNLPTSWELSKNYPNPFNPSTNFSLSMPEAANYEIRIFNITGQTVKTFEGHAEAGVLEVTWHGDNDQGQTVASGVYFLRAEAGDFSQTRKMMLLK
jgi:hypothetical protein